MPKARFHDGFPGRYRKLPETRTTDASRSRAEAYGQIEEPEGPNQSRVSRSLADAKRHADAIRTFMENARKAHKASRGCDA
jgi:hypothetical protein